MKKRNLSRFSLLANPSTNLGHSAYTQPNFLFLFSKVLHALLAVVLATGSLPAFAADQTSTFKVPPVKIPINVKDQRITMVASALITLTRKSQGLNILNLQLNADLSDLQQNMTELLSAELDKDDHCGDRIAVQHATLTPAEPASLAVVQLHYERYACAKVFGKQQSKRVVGGNAEIQMTLTPAIEQDSTELRWSRRWDRSRRTDP